MPEAAPPRGEGRRFSFMTGGKTTGEAPAPHVYLPMNVRYGI